MPLRNDSLLCVLCVLALFRGFKSCVNYLMNEGRCRRGIIGCCVCFSGFVQGFGKVCELLAERGATPLRNDSFLYVLCRCCVFCVFLFF